MAGTTFATSIVSEKVIVSTPASVSNSDVTKVGGSLWAMITVIWSEAVLLPSLTVSVKVTAVSA